MKQKVLVFTTAYHPFIGGAEIAIQETVKRLRDRFDFYIITYRFSHVLRKEELIDGATVFRLGFGTKLDRLFFFPFLAFFKGLAILKDNRPALLWGVMVSYASIGAFLIKFLRPRTSFLLTLQEGDSERHLKFAKLGQAGIWWWLMLKFADEITAISTYLEKYARRMSYGGPSTVIHNGVDLQKFKSKNEKLKINESKIIITTSRLVSKNGIDILIKAIAEVKKLIPDIQCHIIGEGEERNRLELEIRNLKLEHTVKLFGQMPHNELPKHLAEADIFVRPSRSEGMGNSFIEALASGLPIIGTKVGGITDIIKEGETGLFTKIDDPHDLSEKIKILLRNQELAGSIAENGREMVLENFSWDKIAELYAIIFKKKLAKKILITTGLFPPEVGGPAVYSKLLFDKLPKEEFTTRVLPFSLVRRYPYLFRHIIYFFKILWIGRWADIIYAQDPTSVGFPSVLASFILQKKFILKIVGDRAWEKGVQKFKIKEFLDEFVGRSYGPRIAWLRFLQKLAARRAIKIVVPSNYLKSIVRSWGAREEKIAVVRNGFDAPKILVTKEEARRDLGLSGIALISIGRLVPWKGFAAIIEILPELIREAPSISLYIIGSGPDEALLKEKIKKLGLADAAFLVGSVTHDKVLLYLRAGDIFILNTAYEGFSHTLLEAMASGIPIVTTFAGGNREIIDNGHSGILVDFMDKQALSRAVFEILRGKDLREKLIQNAKIKVSEFSEEKMLKETINILNTL